LACPIDPPVNRVTGYAIFVTRETADDAAKSAYRDTIFLFQVIVRDHLRPQRAPKVVVPNRSFCSCGGARQ
jgi:hypothetical protein